MGVNSSPRNWVSGETVTAAEMNAEIRDFAVGVQAAWTTYTSTLTASGSNPTGQTYQSAYMRIGKTIHVRAHVTLAATTGAGNYSIALPVNALATVEQSLHGFINDTGVGDYRIALRFLGGTAATVLCDPSTAGAIMRAVTPTVPFTLGVGDIIQVSGTYEAA